MRWPIHPAADLFPLLAGDELAALTADIAEHGLHEPVWLWEDPERGIVLLDGRNRVAACEPAGVEVTTRYYLGDDPIGFVVSENVKRRHMTPGQIGLLAVGMLDLYEAEAAKRKAHGTTAPGRPKQTLSPPGDQASANDRKATAQAARVVGTSRNTVARAKRVIAAAEPELVEKVKAGTMPIARAERILRDREAEQRRIEQAHRDAEVAETPVTVDLRRGDFRDVLADLTDVDAIITDPPYPAEYLHLLDDLAIWADKVLAADGVLAVLMGQTHLPEVFRRLDGHRPYRWTGAYLTPGAGYVSHPRGITSNWKPILIYGGGPRIADVFRSEGTDAAAKDLHSWGQDYAAFHTLVERLTARGQTVVDPFAGSGTTLLAARALGRNAVGAELDPEAYETARRRLS